jgi:peptidoglycan hydrolase FlgJ
MPIDISNVAAGDNGRIPRGLIEKSSQAAALQRGKVGNDFEAMFLRQTLENILPSGESTIFGTGPAGGIWRSMLADCVSAVIAQRGDFDPIGHLIQPNQDGSGASSA